MKRDWSNPESVEITPEDRDMATIPKADDETVKELMPNARDRDADDERVTNATNGLAPVWYTKYSLLFDAEPDDPRVDPNGEHVRFTVSRSVEVPWHDADGVTYFKVIGKQNGDVTEVVVGMDLM